MKSIDLLAAYDEKLAHVSQRLTTAGQRASTWLDEINSLMARNRFSDAAETRKNALQDLAHQKAAADIVWAELFERALYADIDR